MLEQEKREQQQQQNNGQQQQQQPQGPPPQQQQPGQPQIMPQQHPGGMQPQQPQMGVPPMGQQQPMPVGAGMMQARPVMQGQQGPQGPPVGAAGFPQRPMMMAGGQRPPMGGMMGQPQGQWQVRYPQEVTLQQRGPMMGGPPQQVMGLRGPVPQRMPGAAEPHPAFIRQESIPTPPPPLNTKAMTPPPENPQTDADRAKVVQYEQWLNEHNKNIEEHLRHYETEISKLRKQRKVSS